MSSVLRRNRSVSRVDYLTKSHDIRNYITRMVMNEKIVPKRYRFIFSNPIIENCRDLTKSANKYYNWVSENVLQHDANQFIELYNRKMSALRDMLDACDNILDYFQSIKLHTFIKVEFREKVVGLLVEVQEIVQERMLDENEKYTNYFHKDEDN